MVENQEMLDECECHFGGPSTVCERVTQSFMLGEWLDRNLARRAAGWMRCLWGCAAVAAGILLLSAEARAASPFAISNATEFSKIADTTITALTNNATVSSLLEGPVWIPASNSTGGYLLFSAMDLNRVKKLVPPSTVTDYLTPSTNAIYNGSTLDAQERYIVCKSGSAGFAVAMITNNGSTPVEKILATTCGGLKFYSPNDVVVKSDGTIWFTDPGFNSGVYATTSGYAAGYYVYRFNPTNGNASCAAVITSMSKPNGLCFSPDETKLYVAEYYGPTIKLFNVSSNNTVSGGSVFVTLPSGNPDGIRCDADGRIYSSSSTGVWIFNTNGAMIGRIITAHTVNNFCFGGPDWKTLYIAANPNILSVRLKVAGAVMASKKAVKVSRVSATSLKAQWPWPSTGFQLESSPDMASTNWTAVSGTTQAVNGTNFFQIDTTNSAAFFRLRKPGS